MEAMVDIRLKTNRKSIRDGIYLARNCGQRGSMLLEVLIAVLIFSMGVLALVGLQGATVKFTTDAKYRSDASFLASQTIGQMWIDYANIPTYIGTSQPATDMTTPVGTVLPGGTRAIQVLTVPPAVVTAPPQPNGYLVTVTVGWVTPGGPNGETSSPHQFVTVAQIHP